MSMFEEWYAKEDDGSTGLIPGILLGEVMENWDSEHPGMVRVRLLLGAETKNELDWIPVASAYAGKEYGAYLLPEIGAQVLVAFYMGQPQSPYVIGCLWNQTNTLPPDAAKEKNPVKVLCTKGGNRIEISDEEGKETIGIKTKAEHTILLDDENQKIMFADKDGKNAVTLDAGEGVLTFAAEKKVVFSVGGKELMCLDGEKKEAAVSADNIRVEAGQKLKLKGQNATLEGSSTELKGQNIKAEAQASLELKGTASLKAESSGIFQAKGSMVKLN